MIEDNAPAKLKHLARRFHGCAVFHGFMRAPGTVLSEIEPAEPASKSDGPRAQNKTRSNSTSSHSRRSKRRSFPQAAKCWLMPKPTKLVANVET
jgi:hypothetical protein